MHTINDSAVLKPLGRLLACAAALCLCAASGCASSSHSDRLSDRDREAINSAIRSYDHFLHDDSEATIAPGLPDALTVRQKRVLTFALWYESLGTSLKDPLRDRSSLSPFVAKAIEFAAREVDHIVADFRLVAETQPNDEDQDIDAPEIRRINEARYRLDAMIDFLRSLHASEDDNGPSQ